MAADTLFELRMALGANDLYWRFLAVFAGSTIYFPKRREGEFYTKLVRVVGPDAAETVRQHFAGQHVAIPCGSGEIRKERDLEVVARLRTGESPEQVARTYSYSAKLSPSAIRSIKAKAGL